MPQLLRISTTTDYQSVLRGASVVGMGQAESKATAETKNVDAQQTTPEKVTAAAVDDEPKKLKPCCACPESRKIRDACIMEKGEVNCLAEIEAHKKCLRELGFKV